MIFHLKVSFISSCFKVFTVEVFTSLAVAQILINLNNKNLESDIWINAGRSEK